MATTTDGDHGIFPFPVEGARADARASARTAPAPPTAPTLARLEKLSPREAWANEASDFTPWLASSENIALLSDALGLDLVVEAQGQSVGPFRADILCRDLASGDNVLVENQLAPTDHRHLGQVMTYAAGLNAATVVWIAESFTDEHRVVLEWLNGMSGESFRFFGVELELLRIGDSPMAPRLNVVVKPNGWSSAVARAARQGELTPRRQKQLEFWTAFRQRLKESGSELRVPEPPADYRMRFSIGRSGCQLEAAALFEEKHDKVWVAVRLSSGEDFARLRLQQADLEAALYVAGLVGDELVWERSGAFTYYVFVQRENVGLADAAHWPVHQAWMANALQAMHAVFAPRIARLP